MERGEGSMEFQYYLPVNLIFGQGKADLVGEETARYGRRALVVTGRNSARKPVSLPAFRIL